MVVTEVTVVTVMTVVTVVTNNFVHQKKNLPKTYLPTEFG